VKFDFLMADTVHYYSLQCDVV